MTPHELQELSATVSRLILYVKVLIGIAGFAIMVDFVALAFLYRFKQEGTSMWTDIRNALDVIKRFAVFTMSQKNETTEALGKMVTESTKTQDKIDKAAAKVVETTVQKVEEIKALVPGAAPTGSTPDPFPVPPALAGGT